VRNDAYYDDSGYGGHSLHRDNGVQADVDGSSHVAQDAELGKQIEYYGSIRH